MGAQRGSKRNQVGMEVLQTTRTWGGVPVELEFHLSPGKIAFFEFLAMRAGGWKKIRDRIDRGCSPITGQLRGQEKMFMNLVDLDDFTHRVLDFYDRPEK